jgi:hypothetical protein
MMLQEDTDKALGKGLLLLFVGAGAFVVMVLVLRYYGFFTVQQI